MALKFLKSHLLIPNTFLKSSVGKNAKDLQVALMHLLVLFGIQTELSATSLSIPNSLIGISLFRLPVV